MPDNNRLSRVTRNLLENLSNNQEDSIIDIANAIVKRRTRRVSGGFTSSTSSSTSSGPGFAEHHDLLGITDDDHTQYVHNSQARNITASHTFKHNTPFVVDNDTVITNLNADKLDGYHQSDFFNLAQNETVSGIPLFNGGTSGESAPFSVDSNYVVANLNADKVDGFDFNQEVKTTSSPTFVDLTISSPSNIYALSHDSFANFVANEHIDWTNTTNNFLTTGTANTGSLKATTTNDTKLILAEDESNSVAFNVTDTGSLVLVPTGTSVLFADQKGIGSNSYTSGFAGSGWQVTHDSNSSEYTAEFDNLTVRGTMSVYELLIQQIRATNGSLIIGSADKVEQVEDLGGNPNVYKLTIASDENSGSGGADFIHFTENDLILAQKWSGTSSEETGGGYDPVKRVRATVTETSNSSGSSLNADEFKVTLESGDSISASDLPLDFVRIGNTTDANRQGGIYLTSEDTGAPFIDIFNEVDAWADWRSIDKTKARIGRLDGVTDTSAGLDGNQSNKYGLYSNDVYLTGHIQAKTGYIGTSTNGWSIDQYGFTNVGSTSSTRIGIGSGGYGNSDQKFWVDGSGQFSLGDKLTWSGTALTIKGTIQLSDGTEVTDSGLNWRGNWATGTSYAVNDGVAYENSSYICISAHTSTNDNDTGTGKPNTSNSTGWNIMAQQGTDGDVYATTSSTSFAIPTSTDAQETLTIGTGLAYTVGQSVIVSYDSNNKFTGTVDGYNSGSGVMTVTRSTHTGSGTYSSWSVNLEGAPGPQGVAGNDGDSVDIIFRRSSSQPDTPSASSSTPTNWYSDVNSVPNGSDPIWSSVGTKAGGQTNFTWEDPIQLEGQDGAEGLSVAEISIFKRSSSTPSEPGTAGSYSFNTSVLSNPPSGWTSAIPSGTNPLYTSRAVVTSTSSTGSDNSITWSTPVIMAQDGATGSAGKLVQLTSDAYVITYDADGSNPSPNGTLTLTATSQNFNDAYFKFTGTALNDESEFTNGASGDDADTFSVSIPNSYFSTPKTARVGVAESTADTTELAYDTITLVAVKPGTDGTNVTNGTNGTNGNDGAPGDTGAAGDDAHTGFISNASHVVAADNNGNSYNLTGSGGTFHMYDGATDVTGSNTTYTISSGTNQSSYWEKEQNGLKLKLTQSTGVYSLSSQSQSAWTSDSETFTMTAAHGGVTLTQVYTITKSIQGDTGQTGQTGQTGSTGPQGPAGVDNQDFSWAGETLATLDTTGGLAAGLAMTSDMLGFHGAIDAGDNTNAQVSDFSTYMDSSGNFFFANQGNSNVLSWEGESLAINDSNSFLGITTEGDSTAMGGLQGFFAGGSDNKGDDSTISITSDGKIRGSGIVVRDEIYSGHGDSNDKQDWHLESSRLFGDGADGNHTLYVTNNSTEVVLTSSQYSDDIIKNPSNSNPHWYLLRDVYFDTLTIDCNNAAGQAGSVYLQTNGFRIFVRNKIIFKSYSTYSAVIRNNGGDGGDGGNGEAGTGTSGDIPTGGDAGAAGAECHQGELTDNPVTLLGGKVGKIGKQGGNGGYVTGTHYNSTTITDAKQSGSQSASYYANGTSGSSQSSSYRTFNGASGANGGAGGEGQNANVSGSSQNHEGSSGGGAGGSGGSGGGGTSTGASTKIQSLDPHLLMSARDVFSTESLYLRRIAGGASGGSGGAGSGGGAAVVFNTNNAGIPTTVDTRLNGGGGGGSGGSGGSGGFVMIYARIIEKEDNGSGKVYIQAQGGDGGNGGDGGSKATTEIQF